MNRVLIDTNVLIYALDKDSSYHLWSRRFFNDPNVQCVTTTKNISEFICVITKHSGYSIDINEAVASAKIFLSHCDLFYPDFLSVRLWYSMIQEYNITGLAVHDCEIASIALSNDVKKIATVNRKDFETIKELEVITP
jgi:predicted nucleic acid-binding protein